MYVDRGVLAVKWEAALPLDRYSTKISSTSAERLSGAVL